MSEENLDQFFQEFKAVRKSKKLSVNDISKEIKLQKEYITAIESGNFDILSPVYIRLFLKSYCEYLGMDVDKVLRQYENHISGKSKKKTSDETPKFIDKKSKNIESAILDINPESSDDLNTTYFVEPKKIIMLSSFCSSLLLVYCHCYSISQ